MQHKAQDIFKYFETIFNTYKEKGKPIPCYLDYLKQTDDLFVPVLNITPHYDTFDKEKIAYIEVLIHDNATNKDIMKFSINSLGGMVVRDDFDIVGVQYPQEKYINLLIDHLSMSDKYQCPISVKEIEPIPAGSNPYRYDAWRQGSSISKFWEVMYSSRNSDDIDNVILINTKTGRRFSLDLHEAEKPLSLENNDAQQID